MAPMFLLGGTSVSNRHEVQVMLLGDRHSHGLALAKHLLGIIGILGGCVTPIEDRMYTITHTHTRLSIL
jgi:hypothetical protein